MVHLDDLNASNICFMAKNENIYWLWHRKLGHASMNILHKLIKNDLVKGLPKIDFDKVCDACVKDKQKRIYFKLINDVSTIRVLQLIQIYLFGPIRTTNLSENNLP